MSRLKQLIILLSVLVVGLVGSWTGWLPVDKAARALVRPISTTLTAVGRRIGRSIDELGQTGTLGKQRDELAAQNANLLEQNIEKQRLEQENQQLRALLDFAKRGSYRVTGADVITFAPDEIRQFIRINKGSSHGLGTGMVVTSGNALVGVVKEVRANTAEVMLVSDPEFRVLAASLDGKTTGIVKGKAGGSLSMERIPRDQSIKNDDVIVTSGLDGSFPKGLEIGTVGSTETSAEGIFQTAQLRSSAQLKRLQVVLIITSYESR